MRHVAKARLLTFILVAGITLVAVPATATPIAAGSSVIYNFDFTGLTPPPPYTNQMGVEFGFTNHSWIADFLFFNGLNATGGIATTFGFGNSFNFELAGLTEPGLLDGVFSIKVIATTDLDITTARALGANTGDTVFPVSVDGTIVPEPTSAALVAAGLLFAFRRRRRAD